MAPSFPALQTRFEKSGFARKFHEPQPNHDLKIWGTQYIMCVNTKHNDSIRKIGYEALSSSKAEEGEETQGETSSYFGKKEEKKQNETSGKS